MTPKDQKAIKDLAKLLNEEGNLIMGYTVAGIIAMLVLCVALIVAGPIFTILALNTLFNLSIPVTFWTWLSTAWLHVLIVGMKVKFKNNQ